MRLNEYAVSLNGNTIYTKNILTLISFIDLVIEDLTFPFSILKNDKMYKTFNNKDDYIRYKSEV